MNSEPVTLYILPKRFVFWISLFFIDVLCLFFWLLLWCTWSNNWRSHDEVYQSYIIPLFPFKYALFYLLSCIVLLLALLYFVGYGTLKSMASQISHIVPQDDQPEDIAPASASFLYSPSIKWYHKILLVAVFLFSVSWFIFYAFFWKEQFGLFVNYMIIYIPLLSPFLLFLYALTLPWLSLATVKWFYSCSYPTLTVPSFRQGLQGIMLVTCSLIFVLVSVWPLFLDSPLLIDGELPAKPRLIAHRGLSELYPENTFPAMQHGLEHSSVSVIESDVTFTSDLIPILFHDKKNMIRTTNIKQVYPSKAHFPPIELSFNESQQLDAGSWFSPQDTPLRIPTFVSILKELKKYPGKKFMFDVQSYFSLRGNLIKLIDQFEVHNQIIYLNMGDEVYEHADRFVFDMIAEDGSNFPTFRSLTNTANVDITTAFPTIRLIKSSISQTIVYVVNDPMLFSALWCLGIHYVTTENVAGISALSKPLWMVQKSLYYLIHILLLSTVFVVGFVTLYLFRKRKVFLNQSMPNKVTLI